MNTTDPDSRSIPVGFGFVQGYYAQAAVNEWQIVLAAEITNSSTDFSQLDPMVTATLAQLARAGNEQLPEAVAADAGYGVIRFHRRGRIKVRTEWRLLMMTHNLGKLRRHRLAAMSA